MNTNLFNTHALTVNPEVIQPQDADYYKKPMEYRIAQNEARLNLVDKEFSAIMAAIRNLRWWVVGSLLVGIGIVVACAAFQATWFQNSLNANNAANSKLLEEMDKRWQVINSEQQKRLEIILDNMNQKIDRK